MVERVRVRVDRRGWSVGRRRGAWPWSVDASGRSRATRSRIKIERRLESAIHVNEAGPVLSGGNVRYELAGRTTAISHGGIGAIQRLVKKTGLTKHISDNLHLLKIKVPYHESDHVMNIAYNALGGGRTLEDIELRRNARVFLEALGTRSIPDPTTAGDFLSALFGGQHRAPAGRNQRGSIGGLATTAEVFHRGPRSQSPVTRGRDPVLRARGRRVARVKARAHCNQENLIGQLKSGVHALYAPVNNETRGAA
ncbi:MAG: hypothetical protein IPK13_26215 [Deltaproteobacteria bacterium]|nr:hypothetical protein [Deltaproteobacteria bacterium]